MQWNYSRGAVGGGEAVAGMKGNLVLGRVREGGNPQWEKSWSDFRDTSCYH